MKFYKVGGAVRDRLLGRPVKDTDWVVVGATPQDLTGLGYRSVGKDFPVFLHPDSKEEYALARTERKTAPGYHGFEFDTSTTVTLEEDLARRDLTINAIAEDADGNLIDPYNGQADLEDGVLRHVSPAFAEDPVRILRLARFAARFGFAVAGETMELMRGMVEDGEVDALVAERVWAELERALCEANPRRFFEELRHCGALKVLFPEIDRLFGVPQTEKYHPEIDTGLHIMLVLDQSVALGADSEVRFAALVHDLGKGTTAKDRWPSHHGHEQRGEKLIRQLCDRYRVPNRYRDLALIVAKYHTHCHRALVLKPSTILDLIESSDALRRPQRFEQFLLACEADARGRTGLEDEPYPQPERLRKALAAAQSVDAAAISAEGLEGKAIAEELRRRRLRAIRDIAPATET